MLQLLLLLAISQLLLPAQSTRPVILVHGLNLVNHSTNWSELIQYINTKISKDVKITTVQTNDNIKSLYTNMWKQVHQTYHEIKPVLDNAANGVTMICYSQGGLICRGIIQYYSQHNVHTFISISAPLMGQYGTMSYLFLNKRDVYKIAYTDSFQRKVSIANYWNDPYHQHLFNKKCKFLPQLNNCSTPGLAKFKENFLKLEQIVLIGGPDDGIISPWQSSQFGYYATNDDSKILEMKNTKIFENNSFGLKDMSKKIAIHTVPGIKHHNWIRNKAIFDYIKQWII